MVLTFLGTAAAEGFPAVFCNCKFCNEARRLGGKNIRTRSQSIVNDDLLIDIPADTYHHFLQNNIAGDKIKYLLVTHAHQDHFYPEELEMRHGAYAHDMRAPILKMLCSEYVKEKLEASGVNYGNVEVEVIEPFETKELGEYSVTALPARHMQGALFYMIKQGGKTIKHANDTGYFFEEVFEYLEKNKVKLDMLAMDCTNVDIPISNNGSHMGFKNIEQLLKRLEEIGCVDDNTIKYVNHFSHNANPLQDVLEQRAGEYGCKVSFDGCRVEL